MTMPWPAGRLNRSTGFPSPFHQPTYTESNTHTPRPPPHSTQPTHDTTMETGKPAGDDKKLMKELGSTFREEGLSLLQVFVDIYMCVFVCIYVHVCGAG